MLFRPHKTPAPQVPPSAQIITLPAPVRGLWTNTNRAAPPPLSAIRLDNYFPTTKGVRVRAGSALYATIDIGGDAVVSMFSYRGGGSTRVFASDGDSIFNLTVVGDSEVVPAADVSGLSDGNFSTHPFSTSAGDFLYALNDHNSDSPLLYDGSSWTAITDVSTPSITGISTTLLSAVWSHGKRLWFVEKNTLSAWYLPVDSIGGAASEFLLSGVFRNGGEILFGTTWSVDSGEGMEDQCLFVTSEGEVAVYNGIDPSDPSLWQLKGVYKVGRPLGKSAFYHVGGEPFFLTDEGIISITEVIRRSREEQSLFSVTYPIEDQWAVEMRTRNTRDWKPVKHSFENMLIVATPTGSPNDDPQYFVANIETGAWARWINHDVTCGVSVDDQCFVGTSDGKVYLIEVTGSDDGVVYNCLCTFSFDPLGAPEYIKSAKQARASFLAYQDVNAKISVSVDYSVSVPAYPSSISNFNTDGWDSGLWDDATWSVSLSNAIPKTTMWQSVHGTGHSHAVQVQQSFGVSGKPYTELVSVAMTFITGQGAITV